MVELAVVGAKNSGKTAVIEGLVGYLVGEGCRVATIKHTSHSHRFDKPGKDSYRHRQAGAALTVAVSTEEVAIFTQPGLLEIQQLQHLTRRQVDVWIIEGDWRADRPKVLVTGRQQELPSTLPENIVATIGPEGIDEVLTHFEAGDYRGLGSFVCRSILDVNKETQD